MPNVPADLAAQLRAGAQGLHHSEAAVDLLIAHGTWLHRGDFVAACVVQARHFLDDHPIAHIDWDSILAFVAGAAGCSSTERQILLLAGELADVASGWTLSELLSGLDDTNTRLVCDAVAHHNGLHERGGR